MKQVLWYLRRLEISAAILLLPMTMAFGQTGKISGRVTDAATGQPLPAVNIVVVGTDIGSASDENGYYNIINVPPGTYSLQASFIGYSRMVVEQVKVNIDLTTRVNFQLQSEAIAGQEVVVEASRPIIQPDISGSEQNIDPTEVEAARSQDINDVLLTNVSINSVDEWEQRPQIRGSAISESKFIVDGVDIGDPLTNRPNYEINLNAIKDIKVQTGGFSAQYGNLRSGMINVVTKDGGSRYSGSLDYQYSAPGLKNFGPMITGFDSPVVKPMVDPFEGAFTGYQMNPDGTPQLDANGDQIPNLMFAGWDNLATNRVQPGDAHYGKPMELYARYLWRHRSQDAIDELQRLQKEGLVDIEFAGDPNQYVFQQVGVRPDWRSRLTLGGPIPFTNQKVKFFLSHNGTSTEYAAPQTPPTYEDRLWHLKLTSNLGENLKLNVFGIRDWQYGIDGGGKWMDSWVSSNPFRSLDGNSGPWNARKLWYPDCTPPREQLRQTYGTKLTHTLSPSTFYVLQLTHSRTDYTTRQRLRNTSPLPGSPWGVNTSAEAGGVIEGRIGTATYADSMAAAGAQGWDNWRDWAMINIGGYWYDETPAGYEPTNYKDVTDRYPLGSCALTPNETYSRSYSFRADLTSQVNQLHEIKAGFEGRYDKVYQHFLSIDPSIGAGRIIRSNADEYTGGVYVQDKLEFQGFIANVGLRGDWRVSSEFPMIDYNAIENQTDGPYSQFLLPGNTKEDGMEFDQFNTYDVIPLRRVSQFLVSPRLGISHPISTVGKLFFNYGHMYQWPSAYESYRIQYNSAAGNRVTNFGNPALDPPRTISYEVGYEQNIYNKMSLRFTGYYKDVNNEVRGVNYHFLAGGSYNTLQNGHFRDVRGLESYLELRRGSIPYISGWASVNYMVSSGSDFGNADNYEDPSQQPRSVSREVSKPDVRPLIKASVDFHTPRNFGPQLFSAFYPMGGMNLNLTFFWQRGSQFTWNPDNIPYVENNVRWRPRQHVDLRFTKQLFVRKNVTTAFYLDVTNLFNYKWLTPPFADHYYGHWAWDIHDWWNHEFEDYMNSLDLEVQRDGSIKGKDRPGDYKTTGKEYIDMPAFTPWSFLFKRDIFFGIKVEF